MNPDDFVSVGVSANLVNGEKHVSNTYRTTKPKSEEKELTPNVICFSKQAIMYLMVYQNILLASKIIDHDLFIIYTRVSILIDFLFIC